MSLRLLQINLQHCKAASAALLLRLAGGGADIVLIQEPWMSVRKLVSVLGSADYKLFVANAQEKQLALNEAYYPQILSDSWMDEMDEIKIVVVERVGRVSCELEVFLFDSVAPMQWGAVNECAIVDAYADSLVKTFSTVLTTPDAYFTFVFRSRLHLDFTQRLRDSIEMLSLYSPTHVIENELDSVITMQELRNALHGSKNARCFSPFLSTTWLRKYQEEQSAGDAADDQLHEAYCVNGTSKSMPRNPKSWLFEQAAGDWRVEKWNLDGEPLESATTTSHLSLHAIVYTRWLSILTPQLIWIPGHRDIPGNCIADELARKIHADGEQPGGPGWHDNRGPT
ncbi:hypothetical protein ACLKA7_005526 [Drosophila subpalustris]